MHTGLTTLRYITAKNDINPRLIPWVPLEEFDFKLKNPKGTKNQVAAHFLCLKEKAMLKLMDELEIDDTF